MANKIHLGDVLLLGHGESHGGGSHRPSMLADAVEAVLAAAYLDGGLEVPRKIISRFILQRESAVSGSQDYKTRFQELVQREPDRHISYRLASESGPDHDKRFTVEVLLNDEPVGSGEGSSKKRAEQAAAKDAMERLFPGE